MLFRSEGPWTAHQDHGSFRKVGGCLGQEVSASTISDGSVITRIFMDCLLDIIVLVQGVCVRGDGRRLWETGMVTRGNERDK